jgi:hypothetical protein
MNVKKAIKKVVALGVGVSMLDLELQQTHLTWEISQPHLYRMVSSMV